MRQKTTVSPKQKKSRRGKSLAQASLLDAPGARSIERRFVTAAQITGLFPSFDEPALRRLDHAANLNPTTRAPWIPKPIRGKWDLDRTAAGIIAWLLHKLDHRDGLPEGYASKTDFTGITKFPEAMLDHAIAKGCRCRDDHGRISLTPFLEFWSPEFKKIVPLLLRYLNGEIVEGADLAALDLNDERAKLTRVQKLDQEIDLELKRGRICDLSMAEARMLEIASTVREAIVQAVKKWRRLRATVPDIDRQIFEHDLPHFLNRLSLGQPALGLLELTRTHADQPADFEI